MTRPRFDVPSGPTRIPVRIVTRASRAAVVGMRSGMLLVRVTAAPVDGAANLALIRLVAKRLRVAHTSVRIVSGKTSKVKLIEVDGLDLEEALRRLGVAPALVDDVEG